MTSTSKSARELERESVMWWEYAARVGCLHQRYREYLMRSNAAHDASIALRIAAGETWPIERECA